MKKNVTVARKRQFIESSQEQFVLALLQRNTFVTTLDLQKQGVSSPSGVIKRLRNRGYTILTKLVTVTDFRDGQNIVHRNMAQYRLEKKGGAND